MPYFGDADQALARVSASTNTNSPDDNSPSSSSPQGQNSPLTRSTSRQIQNPPAFSPGLPSGPMSPSISNPSFIFPIRSVFQGMRDSESSQLSKNNTRQSGSPSGSGTIPSPKSPTGGSSDKAGQSRSSGGRDDRRSNPILTSSSSDGITNSAMQTIEQMLQKDSNNTTQPAPSGQTGRVVFTGRAQSLSKDGGSAESSPRYGQQTTEAPSEQPTNGFFSMPTHVDREVADSPFFATEQRRRSESAVGLERQAASASDDEASDTSTRPQVGREDSGESHDTRKATRNDSGEAAEGNGLPDNERPPVGQPAIEPTGVNFRHFPGNDPEGGDEIDLSTAESRLKHREDVNKAEQVELQQPKPQSAAGVRGLQDIVSEGSKEESGRSSRSLSIPGNRSHLELDESGEQALINDFSGIVRLSEAGSSVFRNANVSSTGSGSAGRGSKGQSSSNSRPHGQATAGRLAQQNRNEKDFGMVVDPVRDFVDKQANAQYADPNAPTPSPGPPESDEGDILPLDLHDDTRGLRLNRSALQSRDTFDESDQSGQSLSALDSSERVTLSGRLERGPGSEASDEPIVTYRFEHIATPDGHHVVSGREGTLSRCEDEPITTPGAVQGFGVLVVLEDNYDTGDLRVRQVSENATEILGLSPKYLFRLECFTRIFTEDQEEILRDNLDFLPDSTSSKTNNVEDEGPQVFLLSGYGEPGSDDSEDTESETDGASQRRREWTCWVAAHRPKQASWGQVDEQGNSVPSPDLIILEFELERDTFNPLTSPFPTDESSSGNDTPDSGSVGTRSAGDKSGGDSGGSMTTVGTTSRPEMQARGSGSDVSGETPKEGGTSNLSSGSTLQLGSSTRQLSYRRAKHSRAMGLDGIEIEHPLEKILESTTNYAKPLRALERMRRQGVMDGPETDSPGRRRPRPRPNRRAPISTTGTMDVFAVLGQINEQLGSAPDLDTFLKIAVGVVQDLCRFHRVLIYQFDENYNGQVVSEFVEWGQTTDIFKGLMFPAADIPAQARELYKINKVRMLYDRSQTTARMVLRSKEDLDHPLDMTHCYLRAMSPIHLKYLQNMNVRSSMSVSIMAFGQLWGLIACHSYGYSGMRVSFPVRQMLRVLSDSISRNIERLSYAQRLHTRKLISTIPTTSHPTGYIVSNADDLLQIFDADAGLLVIGDGCKLLGQTEQGQAMLAISEYLRIMKFDTMKASHHIAADFPDLALPRAPDSIAGLLYVPLSAKGGQDFIVLLRKGQAREVQWAGKPYKDQTADQMASLEPRKSFKKWSETVTGRSRAWTDDQLESAGVLALIYGKFIQVWREKQSAMASNQLTAILLSNTSHAVRTPLSQIINTLELALAGNLDDDTRSMLENSHQASRALLFHVHDLLDLTRIETGNETAFNDPFDIRRTIADGTRLYQVESNRRGLDFRVRMDPELPESVIGDSRKIKTVISNLVANSVKFTEHGYIEVYCGLQHNTDTNSIVQDGHVPLEIVISDSGSGIPTEKLEAMFVTLEGVEENGGQNVEGTGLGLGLAVVARIVEQLDGQLRAESEVGVGTRFFFTLTMRVNNLAGAALTKSPSAGSQARGPSSSDGSAVSRASTTSEIDSFVQEFSSSHMVTASQPAVGYDDPRIREAENRMNKPGTFPITDSSYPVRPTRIDGGDSDQSPAQPTTPSPHLMSTPHASITSPRLTSAPSFTRRISTRHTPPKILSLANSLTKEESSPTLQADQTPTPSGILSSPFQQTDSPMSAKKGSRRAVDKLRILVVEDDPINSQILQKRLRMDKHHVTPVENGQEAVDRLRSDWDYDMVLMDIQMPIMDGKTAAKEIRKLESTLTPQRDIEPVRIDRRIPIFAVSASLYESDRSSLAEDFDGWLLKPVDFTRVRIMLKGLHDSSVRAAEVYQQGHWEKGGYLRAVESPRHSSAARVQSSE